MSVFHLFYYQLLSRERTSSLCACGLGVKMLLVYWLHRLCYVNFLTTVIFSRKCSSSSFLQHCMFNYSSEQQAKEIKSKIEHWPSSSRRTLVSLRLMSLPD
uniref:Uncharacterized protein n=1 Tax=Cacopsylla melanoneura TaxID=428564 RepID=A0A8D8RK36_9HEMI